MVDYFDSLKLFCLIFISVIKSQSGRSNDQLILHTRPMYTSGKVKNNSSTLKVYIVKRS